MPLNWKVMMTYMVSVKIIIKLLVASKHQFLKANFQSDLTHTCLPAFALVMYFMSGRARNDANFVIFVMATIKLLS